MGLLTDLYIEERRKSQDHDDYTVFKRTGPHIREIWTHAEALASDKDRWPRLTTATASALLTRAIFEEAREVVEGRYSDSAGGTHR